MHTQFFSEDDAKMIWQKTTAGLSPALMSIGTTVLKVWSKSTFEGKSRLTAVIFKKRIIISLKENTLRWRNRRPHQRKKRCSCKFPVEGCQAIVRGTSQGTQVLIADVTFQSCRDGEEIFNSQTGCWDFSPDLGPRQSAF